MGCAPYCQHLSDEDLMLRFAAGDDGAFTALVQRNRGWAAAYVRSHVSDFASAEDICQEAFLRLLLARDRYQCSGSFKGYLRQILLNEMRRHWRQSKRVFPQDEITPPTPIWSLPQPAQHVTFLETKQQIMEMVQGLPPLQKEALVLYGQEQLSYMQIAEKLNVTCNHVKVLLHRARNRVRRQLA